MISLIAAVSKNGVIGVDNKLPWHLPEDLKRFRELTRGKTVLMGRKTFESILKQLGKPLPNRKNVVVTRDMNYRAPLTPTPIPVGEGGRRPGEGTVEIFHSVADALNAHKGEDIMVIGGGEIYKQTIDRADTLYITAVDKEIAGDTFFPPIDRAVWKESLREQHEGFVFVNYTKI